MGFVGFKEVVREKKMDCRDDELVVEDPSEEHCPVGAHKRPKEMSLGNQGTVIYAEQIRTQMIPASTEQMTANMNNKACSAGTESCAEEAGERSQELEIRHDSSDQMVPVKRLGVPAERVLLVEEMVQESSESRPTLVEERTVHLNTQECINSSCIGTEETNVDLIQQLYN